MLIHIEENDDIFAHVQIVSEKKQYELANNWEEPLRLYLSVLNMVKQHPLKSINEKIDACIEGSFLIQQHYN